MMKALQDYITEAADRAAGPVVGDVVAINLREDCLLETHVIETTDDGVVVATDDLFMSLLENYGCTIEEVARYGPVGSSAAQGYTVAEQGVDKDNDSDAELRLIRSRAGVSENSNNNDDDFKDWESDDDEYDGHADEMEFQKWLKKRGKKEFEAMEDDGAEKSDVPAALRKDKGVKEAEYQGRKVELNKPMSGDVAKSKVYVKDPKTGNVKKVNFGDPNMRIKKSNPERRKSFRARHKCDTAKDKTTARYWSCRAW